MGRKNSKENARKTKIDKNKSEKGKKPGSSPSWEKDYTPRSRDQFRKWQKY